MLKTFKKIVSKGKLSTQTLQVAKEGAKGKLTKPKAKLKAKSKVVNKVKPSLELESDKKTGVEKLQAKIQVNRDMGPGNRILNNRIEQEFKQQIEKVKQLETEFSANELRAKIKKAKGKEKQNLELALQ